MDAFMGEIRAFPYTFIPAGWFVCDGSTKNVQQYPALYSLIGTRFGGNGQTTFNLPNLLGFALIGTGQSPTTGQPGLTVGQTVGTQTVTLTPDQMPTHQHVAQTQATTNRLTAPSSSSVALSPEYVTTDTPPKIYALPMYVSDPPTPAAVEMNAASIAATGDGQPHPNMSPYVAFLYCICNDGMYPDFS